MKMNVIAVFAFLANAVLFATYYAVAKEALGRIDPILFTFFEMTTLAPVALGILAFTCHQLTWTLVKRGVLLGSCLCLALFTIAIALKYSTATGTAFFPALNGFLAALIARLLFRQPMNKATWCAGILSLVGTSLLLMNSEMGGIRGTVIAFLGGLFFTLYVFLSDDKHKELATQEELAPWPLFGIELLTMALWACLVALLFGDWQAFHPLFPKDALVILYVAGACTLLPTCITVLLQKHISAVSVSFIYILEPVLGAIIANFYLHEVLPLYGYLGGGLVVVGAFLHTLGSVERTQQPAQEVVQKGPVHTYSLSKDNFYDTSQTWLEETRTTQKIFSHTSMSFDPTSTTGTRTPTTGPLRNSAIWGGSLDTSISTNKAGAYEDFEDYYDIVDITPQDFLADTLTDPISMHTNRSKEQHLTYIELVEYVE